MHRENDKTPAFTLNSIFLFMRLFSLGRRKNSHNFDTRTDSDWLPSAEKNHQRVYWLKTNVGSVSVVGAWLITDGALSRRRNRRRHEPPRLKSVVAELWTVVKRRQSSPCALSLPFGRARDDSCFCAILEDLRTFSIAAASDRAKIPVGSRIALKCREKVGSTTSYRRNSLWTYVVAQHTFYCWWFARLFFGVTAVMVHVA